MAKWRNYFSQLFNVHGVKDVGQAEIHTAELSYMHVVGGFGTTYMHIHVCILPDMYSILFYYLSYVSQYLYHVYALYLPFRVCV